MHTIFTNAYVCSVVRIGFDVSERDKYATLDAFLDFLRKHDTLQLFSNDSIEHVLKHVLPGLVADGQPSFYDSERPFHENLENLKQHLLSATRLRVDMTEGMHRASVISYALLDTVVPGFETPGAVGSAANYHADWSKYKLPKFAKPFQATCITPVKNGILNEQFVNDARVYSLTIGAMAHTTLTHTNRDRLNNAWKKVCSIESSGKPLDDPDVKWFYRESIKRLHNAEYARLVNVLRDAWFELWNCDTIDSKLVTAKYQYCIRLTHCEFSRWRRIVHFRTLQKSNGNENNCNTHLARRVASLG